MKQKPSKSRLIIQALTIFAAVYFGPHWVAYIEIQTGMGIQQ